MRRTLWVGLLVCLATRVDAQSFAGAAPAGSERAALGLLEDAQPAVSHALFFSAAQTRWWGLAELETRALALAFGIRSLRVAAGLSQTGTPELGYTAVGFATGVASPTAGAGVRVATSSDRDAEWTALRATSHVASYEAGAGAWLAPAELVRVWVSAPQWITHGAPPVLARTLEVGVRAGDGNAIWCALRAPRSGDDGERSLGGALAFDLFQVWLELRDAPLRSAAGLGLAWRGLELSVRLDSHPVLGETVRTGVSWAIGRGAR